MINLTTQTKEMDINNKNCKLQEGKKIISNTCLFVFVIRLCDVGSMV